MSKMLVKPEVMLIDDVLDELADGKVRVPKFQRPFIWRPSQMTALFDSIERGYPIGSVLLWETPEKLRSLDHVAGIRIPTEESRVAYLLDGHQRLSTLLGVLRSNMRPEKGQEWIWRIGRNLEPTPGSSQYLHWKGDGEYPHHLMPMSVIGRTTDYLAFARRLSEEVDDEGRLTHYIEEGESVTQRVRSYRLAVIRLIGGTLEEAVEVFSRLNSSGQAMTADQMFSALAYRESDGWSLADQIDEILESLSEAGFADLSRSVVFKSVLVVSGEDDVQSLDWHSKARNFATELREAAGAATRALSLVSEFLTGVGGLVSSRLLPYGNQVVVLTAFFAEKDHVSESEERILVKWFWHTSWTGAFAGASSTDVKRFVESMRSFARGEAKEPMGFGGDARSYPTRFDLRSARVRTLLLWFFQSHKPLSVLGERLDVKGLIEASETSAFAHVLRRGAQGFNLSDPANRLILPTRVGVSVKATLEDLAVRGETAILQSHGFGGDGVAMLATGNFSGALQDRAARLALGEREFMKALGILDTGAVDLEAGDWLDTDD